MVAALFESLLAMLSTLREQQLAIAKQLARVARQSGACRLMMTMPGVGPLTAVSFMTTIEDPHRFRRSQDVGAYLGLTPRRYQSGEVDINGRIAAIGRRSGFWKARVALARKLAVILHRMWIDGRGFDPKVTAMA